MNDPHLTQLVYAFWSPARFDFSGAAPRDVDLAGFDCHLEGHRLVAKPRHHYSSVAEGRDQLDPRLRAWEAATEIDAGVQIEFRFTDAEVIDRAPTPGEHVVAVTTGATARFSGGGVAVQLHGEYPPAPADSFIETPLVAQLREDLNEHRRGARLLAQSQLILTRIQTAHGGRDGAAAALNISKPVLSKLGELNERGHPGEGRKVKASGSDS